MLQSVVNKTKGKFVGENHSKIFQDIYKHSRKHFKKEANNFHIKNKQTKTKINSKVNKSNMLEWLLEFFEFPDHDVKKNTPYSFEED